VDSSLIPWKQKCLASLCFIFLQRELCRILGGMTPGTIIEVYLCFGGGMSVKLYQTAKHHKPLYLCLLLVLYFFLFSFIDTDDGSSTLLRNVSNILWRHIPRCTSCPPPAGCLLWLIPDTEDGGSMFLRNFGKILPDCTAPNPLLCFLVACLSHF
jgi:hypothetical protein